MDNLFLRGLLGLGVLAGPVCCFAEGDSNDLDPIVKEAIADAENEYEATLKKEAAEANKGDPAPSVSLPRDALRFETAATLDELAAQVDALKNKVIVERATLLATQSPKKVRVRGANTFFTYRPEAIFEVTVSLNHVTDIALEPGETLTSTPQAGDTERWSLSIIQSGKNGSIQNHLVLKPLDEGVETNMIVGTDRRTYHLKIKESSTHMPAVSWTYPENMERALANAVKLEQSEERTVAPENLNFNYDIHGDKPSWRPVRVFDDGLKTFLQMPEKMRVTESPALFVLDENKDPILVNYRVKGSYYIIDRLFDRAEMRVGAEDKVRITVKGKRSFFERLFN
jgi:P-type conjugative transfer protein TrbG